MEKCEWEFRGLRRSKNSDKKFDAMFRSKGCPCGANDKPACGAKEKIVSFGAAGMSDYTKHKDPARKELYIKRHSGMGEDWNDPLTPGALSRWILWNKPSLEESIKDYKKRFDL